MRLRGKGQESPKLNQSELRRTAEDVARMVLEAEQEAREADWAEWRAQEPERRRQRVAETKMRERLKREKVTACCLHMAHVEPEECQCQCHEHPRRITLLLEWMVLAVFIGCIGYFIAEWT